tara:strand:+ start:6534 stop:7247 length:714 start_codon:yes stop_codon:yes gene_type:complete
MNQSNQRQSIEKGFHNTLIIGSPFLYLQDIIKQKIREIPKSLLLFPLHSNEWVTFSDPVRTHKIYINQIKKINHLFENISVSLGWREYQNKDISKLFSDQKIKVVTMGNRDNNTNFLFNFYKEVSKHEYISSDTFCTAIFYGLLMNKKCFVYGKRLNRDSVFNDKNYSKDNRWEGPERSYYDFYAKKYPALLWDNFNHKSHFYIAEKELGLRYKRTPDELIKIFEWSLKDFFKSFFN